MDKVRKPNITWRETENRSDILRAKKGAHVEVV
jgi:hypothetical protein